MEWQIDRAIESGSFFGKRKVNHDEEKPEAGNVLSSSSRPTMFNFYACVASRLIVPDQKQPSEITTARSMPRKSRYRTELLR